MPGGCREGTLHGRARLRGHSHATDKIHNEDAPILATQVPKLQEVSEAHARAAGLGRRRLARTPKALTNRRRTPLPKRRARGRARTRALRRVHGRGCATLMRSLDDEALKR